MIRHLGLDPGLAHCGVAIVDEDDAGKLHVVFLDVIETKKSPKEDNIRAGVDNHARACELRSRLCTILEQWGANTASAESMSFPRDSSTAQKMGIAWGVISSICEQLRLPLWQATPIAVKRAVGVEPHRGRADKKIKTEEKKKVIAAVQLLAPATLWESMKPALWEHCADAVGTVFACHEQRKKNGHWAPSRVVGG